MQLGNACASLSLYLSVYVHVFELNEWFSPHCRDGVEWFFVKLHEKNVPVLIISGGLGGIYKSK